jgi:hypothetical protein
MTVPHPLICKVPQSSSEFQKQIQAQRPGRFSNALQRSAPIGRWVKKRPFEHGEVINYTLDGVSIHPVITKIQVSFLTQLPERKKASQGFHLQANGDFKTATEFNTCDGTNQHITEYHCSYFQAWWWLHHVMGSMLVIGKDQGVFIY